MARVILRQSFPLGRFHATPWRINPFDDPFGEWPPSPWRLVRAICARWYQWRRESPARESGELESLLRALCSSTYAFRLPATARRGFSLRQYYPSEFGWQPPGKNKKVKTKIARFPAPSRDVIEQVRHLDGVLSAELVSKNELRVRYRGDIAKLSKLREVVQGEQLGKPENAGDLLIPIPAHKDYGTSLNQDNAWCIPADSSDESAVWWLLDSDQWTPETLGALDACLARIVYFGRAETLTVIERCSTEMSIEPNCSLGEGARSSLSVPVLVPLSHATREDVERVTDDPGAKGRTVPPGAEWRYAELPSPMIPRESASRRIIAAPTNLIQFAVGCAVTPDYRALVRLTSLFRSRALTAFVRLRMGNRKATWSTASGQVCADAAMLSGKDSAGLPLKGPHRHAAFLGWIQDGAITRLLVWRPDDLPFSDDERTAMLQAAERELSWRTTGAEGDDWKVRLVPLDRAVPLPPGFDGTRARVWESLTPYVPPRHHLRNGKPRLNEAIPAQVQRELVLHGIPNARNAAVKVMSEPVWMAIHIPARKRDKRSFVGNRPGYRVRIEFSEPVSGPILLGHSSHFGLGLFAPVSDR